MFRGVDCYAGKLFNHGKTFATNCTNYTKFST
jgi:hypothetical protein